MTVFLRQWSEEHTYELATPVIWLPRLMVALSVWTGGQAGTKATQCTQLPQLSCACMLLQVRWFFCVRECIRLPCWNFYKHLSLALGCPLLIDCIMTWLNGTTHQTGMLDFGGVTSRQPIEHVCTKGAIFQLIKSNDNDGDNCISECITHLTINNI